MYERLLEFLRCPVCTTELELQPLRTSDLRAEPEVTEGLLRCENSHWFPVVGGVPRLFSNAMQRRWADLEPAIARAASSAVREFEAVRTAAASSPATPAAGYDAPTQANFSAEWDHHELGDRTWGMEVDYRVQNYFVDPIGLSRAELAGKILLDAGCGNGSQSVAYSELGLEVIAVDLSSGVDKGHALRHLRPGSRPERVHFVQADLQAPPIARSSMDIIHSAGVLHHTPNTRRTFQELCTLLRDEGTFYVWLYKYEPVVTPLVNALRSLTTRIPAARFAQVANAAADPFRVFCSFLNAVGLRAYPRLTHREAALALMDIFGAPHAHYHSFAEVTQWFREERFHEIWECNVDRRGFGACGHRSGEPRGPALPAIGDHRPTADP